MEETMTRASLVASPEVESQGLTATVPRAQVEEAAKADEPVDLVLDVTRWIQENGGRREEQRTVAVAWEQADLDSLLQQATGEHVTIAIDRASLERALDEEDVEGHGLREQALVLTVAAATAIGAGSAFAAPDAGGGAASGGSASSYEVENLRASQTTAPPSGSTIEQIRAAQEGSDAYGIEGVRAAQQAPDAPDAYPIESVRGAQQAPEATDAYPIESVRAGQESPGTSGDYAIENVRAGGGVDTPDAYPIETVRGAQPTPQATGDEGVTITAPGAAEAAGIAGAIALMITGAAFVLRSRRQPKPA